MTPRSPTGNDAAHDESAELLADCPFCGYSLTGLPQLHRCPECGRDVDRRWRCYGARFSPRALRRATIPLYLLLGVPMLYGVAALGLAGYNSTSGLRLPMLGVLLLVLAAAAVVSYRPRRFIAIGPDGLTILRGRGRLEQFPWPTLGRARHDFPFKRIAVERIEQRPIHLAHHEFFGLNTFEMDRFVREFNSYARPVQ